MIILGIDPGTAITGFAVIKTTIPKHLPQNRSERPKVLDFGCILTHPSSQQENRLKTVYNETTKLIEKYKPDVLSIESLYFFKNLKTAIPVSQSRGVVLLAAAKKNIPIYEFTPLQVKMAIVGYGRADKHQVQKMIKQLLDMGSLNIKEKSRKKDDATDALGIAFCAFLEERKLR